jgi:hypothetical protein
MLNYIIILRKSELESHIKQLLLMNTYIVRIEVHQNYEIEHELGFSSLKICGA